MVKMANYIMYILPQILEGSLIVYYALCAGLVTIYFNIVIKIDFGLR